MTAARKVVLAPAASEDLAEIVDSLIAAAGLDVALRTHASLDAALESLATLADRGRLVPELRERGVTAYREIVELPYRIVYRADPRDVAVVAIVDHRRELDILLSVRARR